MICNFYTNKNDHMKILSPNHIKTKRILVKKIGDRQAELYPNPATPSIQEQT